MKFFFLCWNPFFFIHYHLQQNERSRPELPHNKKDRQVHLTDLMDNTPPTEPSFCPESPEIDVHSPSPNPITNPITNVERSTCLRPNHLSPLNFLKSMSVLLLILDLPEGSTKIKNVNDKIMPLLSSNDSDSDNKITTHAKAPTEQRRNPSIVHFLLNNWTLFLKWGSPCIYICHIIDNGGGYFYKC